MTSYQLPDLLTLLTSLPGDDDDGDLQINPLYNAESRSPLLELLDASREVQGIKVSRQQRTIEEFLQELNCGILASTLVPFPSFPRTENQAELVLGRASEWVALCAIVAEQVLRPGRIVDFESSAGSFVPKSMGGNGSHWDTVVSWLRHQSCSEEAHRVLTEALLNSVVNVPGRPEHATTEVFTTCVEEYVKWRASLSGHALLFELFFSSAEERSRFSRCLELVLEINACVTDLFAYNIHQAWHSKSNGDRRHLNLIPYLMEADAEMPREGAINCVAEMIRVRFDKFRDELDATNILAIPPTSSAGSLTSSLSAFLSSFRGSGTVSLGDSSGDTLETVKSGNDSEIRKVLLNWVSGMIHWAYEVEYFHPDVEGDDSNGKKKKGGEVRDYGWVFLID